MRASPVDLIGGYYKSDSLPWACQDTVNWLPVLAEVEGTASPKMLETPPGLRPYQRIGTGPIRGLHDCEGLRLVVSGRYLFRLTNAGVGVPIGVIPGVGRVSMTHNQFETGYQVLVENGQPGGGYVYSTVDQTFVRITDEGYPGSISSDYLDSFLLGVEPFGRFWFHSDLASATSYNTLDRYEAEASPDKIVGLAVSGQEVVVFGQRTTEFFMNVGAATGTFQNRNTGFDRGCASRDTIAKLDNSIFWLGDDGIVYRLNGYAAQPVSTRALDQQLAHYNLSQAFAFVWEDRGHKVYYLSFPDGQTFGYDVVTALWHRRESFGLDRWRLTHVIEWSGKQYGGDFQDGRLWLLDWDYFLEGAEPIISERVSPQLGDSQNRVGIPNAELKFDTGHGPGTAAVPFPEQPNTLSISGDLPDGGVGTAGDYQYLISGSLDPIRSWVSAGALPLGAVLNSDGSVIYDYTKPGVYTFTVTVEDGIGSKASVQNTVTVIQLPMLLRGQAGSNAVVIRSSDGLDWASNPVVDTGTGPATFALYMTGLNGRFFGRGFGFNGPGAYSDDLGQTWVQTSQDVSRAGVFGGSAGDAICGGDLFLPARAINYLRSSDQGVTFSTGDLFLSKITALGRRGLRMCAVDNVLFRESTDGGDTWSAGSNYTAFLDASDGGSYGSNGERFFYGGSLGASPALVSVLNGQIESHPLPALSGATSVSAFISGNGTILAGTDNGRVFIDRGDGEGFQLLDMLFAGTIRQLFWCYTHFIAVTSPTGGGAGAIYTSEDGEEWISRPLAGAYSLFSVAQLRSM